MKRIPAFQTTDGQTFSDEGKARDHQLMIDIRGLLQSKSAVSTSDNANSPTSAATLIAKHAEAATAILLAYRQKKAGLNKRQRKVEA